MIKPGLDPGESDKTRVLLVEDDVVTSIELEFQLDALGYEVCANVPNGWDALACAERFEPDLVLMDIQIEGDLDGIETASRLMVMPRPPSIIFLTSSDDPRDIGRVTGLRPAGFLSKPVTPSELRASIEIALAKAAMDEQLARSEQRTRHILSTVSDGIVVEDEQGAIVYANPTMAKILGLSEDQLYGQVLADLVHLDSKPVVEAQLARKSQGITGAYDAVLVSASGEFLDVVIHDAPLFDRGVLLLSVSAVTDVTERNNALRRAQEAEARYKGLYENALAGILVSTASGSMVDCNPAAARILGYASVQEALALAKNIGAQHYVCQEDRLRLVEALHAQRQVTDFEVPFYGKDGDLIWVSLAVRGTFSEDGETLLMTETVMVDITDRKVAEANYQATLDLFQRTVSTIPSPLALVDLDGEISLANAAMQKIFDDQDIEGQSYNELLESRLFKGPHHERRKIALEANERVLRFARPDDSFWVFIESRSAYTDHQGEVVGHVHVWRDISGLVGGPHKGGSSRS